MRLGGPVHVKHESPDDWIVAVKELEFSAAFCPVGPDADDEAIGHYKAAAAVADITIAEVGAWSNPLNPDEKVRNEAIEKCKSCLDLADRIGARCCVNIAGSRGGKWDGPSPLDLTDETFDMIVATTRDIIDAVKPGHSFYTLETMPWMYPDSVDSYEKLYKAIDRPQFGVHFDPVNLVCSPQRYFKNGDLIRDFVERLGPYIKSCHAKDIQLGRNLTTHLDECRPGTGNLDYPAFLKAVDGLEADVPVMLEHLGSESEYALAADFIRETADKHDISI